jgi:RNA polymerase sigma factor for flagellar operon FliA
MYEEQVESPLCRGARGEIMGAVLNHHSERDALIEEYHDFVEGLVSRIMRAMGLPQRHRDDFISAGLLGLVEAAGRFDAGRGSDFRAFAFLRIRGAVIDHIRASCEISGYAYQVLKALESAQELRAQSLEDRRAGVSSSDPHAMEGIDLLSKSAVALALVSHSSEAPFFGGTAFSDPERDLQKKQSSEKLRAAIATLPEKERTIIEQYYFHDLTLSEVAQQYAGLSKSWVSRLHDRALGMLREKLVEGDSRAKP